MLRSLVGSEMCIRDSLIWVAIVEAERVRAGQKLHILHEAAPAARVVLHLSLIHI